MNSQQELLNAINSISENKNRSYDTPAEVLRVEGDTVWVHIDGGADETPVLKTINCEQGEKVQVRIANGNAFLVGNASAPPTDDKKANEAHFIAEQADVKAGTAIKSVNALSQTVEGKVDTGDSNIEVLSSTMYQNANGVNIFNGNLAVGDSYAHIDGDSFDIKTAKAAGIIDDTNDETIASFGATSIIRQVEHYDEPFEDEVHGCEFRFNSENLIIDSYDTAALGRGGTNVLSYGGMTIYNYSGMYETFFGRNSIYFGTSTENSFTINQNTDLLFQVTVGGGELYVSKHIKTNKYLDASGNEVLDGWTATATVSNNAVSFSGLSDSYGYDLYCENKLISVTAVSKSGSGSNVTLTYTLSGASAGDVCKLRILR